MMKNFLLVAAGVIVGIFLGIMITTNKYEKKKLEADEESLNFYRQEQFELQRQIEEKKEHSCNVKTVGENFVEWMSFNYPDYKVVSDLAISSVGDCIYDIRFTVIDPHLKEAGMIQKDIIIVRFEYLNNFQQFRCRTVRGTLF